MGREERNKIRTVKTRGHEASWAVCSNLGGGGAGGRAAGGSVVTLPLSLAILVMHSF